MRFFYQIMSAVFPHFFNQVHESVPFTPSPFIQGSRPNYGAGLDWPSIYYARRHNRRAKIMRRL